MQNKIRNYAYNNNKVLINSPISSTKEKNLIWPQSRLELCKLYKYCFNVIQTDCKIT